MLDDRESQSPKAKISLGSFQRTTDPIVEDFAAVNKVLEGITLPLLKGIYQGTPNIFLDK
ncbi:hypothetical protein IQ264_04030 [Phormidium sp. LEGE 05292]|uniref:hypothetical protein n=1 Tax=[Phormidium] sp. LEGE 05292 TaxID=767427 RepID=UPI001881BBCB|nr:hypothetical protein [Phormidium sp. LEGE 05292]MBE9224639.1 hypothetical protein [Phormidium sp. LEGE 05292]